MSSGIKVLVVDDSLMMRTFIAKVLQSDPGVSTIQKAVDGLDALEVLKTFDPDLITLDVEMPRMNGLECLRQIKQKYNIPVIMVSSLTRQGADITIKALEIGAMDFVHKPGGPMGGYNNEGMAQELIRKVQLLARRPKGVRVEKQLVETKPLSPGQDSISVEQFKELAKSSGWNPKGNSLLNFYLVAIGISTGGPSALNEVIPKLPEDLNAAVIVVQHMPATFTGVLAERLNAISQIAVKEAEENDLIQPGQVYIIPGDKHVRINEASNELRIKLDNFPKVQGFRPSAEPLFYYTAEVAKRKSVGVIMTGMGKDGSVNLGLIKAYSGKTIGQSEETCVIYGMPRAAVEAGHVTHIEPLETIAQRISTLVQS